MSNDVVLPFTATMSVTGTTQRIFANQISQTQESKVPADVLESYIRAKGGKKFKVIEKKGDHLLISISGQMKGNLGIDYVISNKIVKRYRPDERIE